MGAGRYVSAAWEMAQPLRWQTYTTGSFQHAARFTLSWKSPRFAVPSPKVHTHTRSEPSSWKASPAPVATPSVVPRSPATHGTRLRFTGPLNGTERPLL